MNLVAWVIVFCEVAFWVVILMGLGARYFLKRPKLGFAFLALTPLIDLCLLIVTGVDLYRGATATVAHAVAAVYIGISLAFGKSMIDWADERFRYYVAKEGPKPTQRYGYAFARHYLKGWFRHLLSYVIGAGLLFGLIGLIDDPSRTEAMNGVINVWSLVLGIDLIISVSYFIWPKKAKGGTIIE